MYISKIYGMFNINILLDQEMYWKSQYGIKVCND